MLHTICYDQRVRPTPDERRPSEEPKPRSATDESKRGEREGVHVNSRKSLSQLRRETTARKPEAIAKPVFEGVLYVDDVPWQVLPRSDTVTIVLTDEARTALSEQLSELDGLDPHDEDYQAHEAKLRRNLAGKVDAERSYVVYEARDAALLVGETTGTPLGWIQRSDVFDWLDRRVLTDGQSRITGFILSESNGSFQTFRPKHAAIRTVLQRDLQEQIRYAYRDTEVGEHYKRVNNVIAALEGEKALSKSASRTAITRSLQGSWLFPKGLRTAIDTFSHGGAASELLIELRKFQEGITKVKIERDLLVVDDPIEQISAVRPGSNESEE